MPAHWPIGKRLRDWMAARTAFFDEVTLTAIEDALRQVVIVGAGYDGRSLRFRDPEVRYFEVDHPATQPDKRRRMHEVGVTEDPAVYVAHDLTIGGLPAALAAAGHDPANATLFVCEGLLLYLKRPTIERLFTELRVCAGPGSRLALNVSERPTGAPPSSRIRAHAQRLLLAAIGEPRRALLAPGELSEMLADAGWGPVREHAVARAPGHGRGVLVLAQ